MPSRWSIGLQGLVLLAGIVTLGLVVPPVVAAVLVALCAGAGFSQRQRLTRMLDRRPPMEPLTLSVGPEGLRLARGAEPPVPLHDAWRIGPIDVLYPAAGTPQLLWPDSLLPADRARMRALMTLHPCSSR